VYGYAGTPEPPHAAVRGETENGGDIEVTPKAPVSSLADMPSP